MRDRSVLALDHVGITVLCDTALSFWGANPWVRVHRAAPLCFSVCLPILVGGPTVILE